jgi:hypothetical protein
MRELSLFVARRWPRLLLLSFLCPLAIGCGPGKKTVVTGKVTLHDKPVESGTLVFIPEDPTVEGGGTANVQDGAYTLRGTKPGKMKIYFVPPTPPPTMPARARRSDSTPKDAPSGHSGSAPQNPKPPLKISLDYLNKDRTPLRYEITPGSQEYDIELK